MRRISGTPGRNASTSPSPSCTARRTARATQVSMRSPRAGGRYVVATGNIRASTRTTAAPPSISASRSVATVAEVANSRRSGRSPARASSSNASSRSASRCRSWHSSSSTVCTPSNSGSAISLRSNSPDVTTSMRVRSERRVSPRTA